MKNLIMTLSLTLMTSVAFAAPEMFTVETVEVQDFSSMKGMDVGGSLGGAEAGQEPVPGKKITTEDVGKVIGVAKDLVALGEDIYTLVQKGKPTSTTDFTPINVVPRDPITKEYADPFEMEGCSMPTQKKYVSTIKSGNTEAVRFEYMVLFTYDCSYNESGKFIQNAMVQPVSVKATYGWDFNATMKVSGIMNHGTKAQPVAGAMITIKYSMNSWRMAFERNDTIHITGKGEIKNYSN
jgi:hypothetical protein